ncbi:MAG TPA: nitroreductase [Chloroflexota bacterium]
MDTLEAIASRRSVGKVTQERPPREMIERILDAAVQAPNHRLSEPWRFFVLAGDARKELGEVMADVLRGGMDEPEGEGAIAQLTKEAEKPLRAPVVIVVASKRSDNPKVVPIEDVEATAAAVENMLLAAHALGLAAMWRTGDAAYHPLVKRLFDLTPEDHIAGFIYVGYPAVELGPRKRTPASDLAEWRGWD